MAATVSNLIRQIRQQSRIIGSWSDGEIKQQSLELRYRAMTGSALTALIPRGFAIVCEAARRRLGYSHYDVQLECGIHLVRNRVAEMATGEGKTLTAALPVFLRALAGRGAHVVTVNDYLARRDRETLGPVYELLGLSSAVITGDMDAAARSQAYRMDITYGSAKEFGFDFLRDRLQRLKIDENGIPRSPDPPVMRGLHFALVDEADSILIDEARTPLIVGMVDETDQEIQDDCLRWAASVALEFVEDTDFVYEKVHQTVKLTLAGRNRLRRMPQTQGTRRVTIRELYQFVENAIKVRRDFLIDRNYSLREGKVVIIDEFTGRPAEGRQWQQGIHQSVEAKESIDITATTRQAARITVQKFFQNYRFLAGMTGTAWSSRREFRKTYKKHVVRIRTHRPVQRQAWPVNIYQDFAAKAEGVVAEVERVSRQGRAVLIGTRSVEISERLSGKLLESGIDHRVLNARHLAQEAEIVAAAGQAHAVTVATNMAGRGTDIKLRDSVRKQGGLHVILTEIHESQRIDWQLIGRGSRQGDPGSYRIFVALDDEILKMGLGRDGANRLRKKHRGAHGLESKAFQFFRMAQQKAEKKHFVDRMVLLKQDEKRQQLLFETGQDLYLDVVE